MRAAGVVLRSRCVTRCEGCCLVPGCLARLRGRRGASVTAQLCMRGSTQRCLIPAWQVCQEMCCRQPEQLAT